jgi:hypothetical protein
VNKNQIRILYGLGVYFGILLISRVPSEGLNGVFDAAGYFAGTFPIWVPIAALLMFFLRTKKQKNKS